MSEIEKSEIVETKQSCVHLFIRRSMWPQLLNPVFVE